MDVRAGALAVIARVSRVAVESLRPDMELVGDLELDSARSLQLLVELEDALGIEIADEDAATMNTVGDILGYLERG